jgi:hypothetical protein
MRDATIPCRGSDKSKAEPSSLFGHLYQPPPPPITSKLASPTSSSSSNAATAPTTKGRDRPPSYKDQMREVRRPDEPSSAIVAVPLTYASPVTDEQTNSEERERLAEINRLLLDELHRQRVANIVQQQPQQLPQPTQPKLWCRIGAVVVVVVVASAAAVFVGIYCGSGNCGRSGSDGVSPPPSPFVLVRSKADAAAIISLINNSTLSNQTLRYPIDAGTTTSTAEERALQWLIDDDLDTAANDTVSLLQRYALSTVWFQSNQPWTGQYTADFVATWTTNIDECGWSDVGCDSDGHVVMLDLWLVGVSDGHIPDDLGLLTALTRLWLSTNAFKATIPSSLGRLTKLNDLWLDVNSLTGTIPTSLGALTKLTYLTLHNNRLRGSVPFCNDDGSATGFFEFLTADCNEVNCPCCTHCCPTGGWNGTPGIPVHLSGWAKCDV